MLCDIFLSGFYEHTAETFSLKLGLNEHFIDKKLAVVPPDFFVGKKCSDNFFIFLDNKSDKFIGVEVIFKISCCYFLCPSALPHFIVINGA